MGKITRYSQSLDFCDERILIGDTSKAIEDINDELQHIFNALMRDMRSAPHKVNFPATIKLEMHIQKWDGQIVATFEWPDEGGFWKEYEEKYGVQE